MRWIVLTVVLTVPLRAFADEASVRARLHFELGSKHFQLAEYDIAAREFEEGYRIKPLPLFLWNAAQSYRHAGDRANALNMYKRYLEADPRTPKIVEVERYLRELEREPEKPTAPAAAPPSAPSSQASSSPPPAPSRPPPPPPGELVEYSKVDPDLGMPDTHWIERLPPPPDPMSARLPPKLATIAPPATTRAPLAHRASLLVLPPAPLSTEVPPTLLDKIHSLLSLALSSEPAVAVVPAARAGADPNGPLPDARLALEVARISAQQRHFADADNQYGRVVELIDGAGIPAYESATLTTALAERVAVAYAANDRDRAKRYCTELVTLRPSVALEPASAPRDVIALCNEARTQLPLRREVTLTTEPARAQVWIDGVQQGATPLTIRMVPGRHWMIVEKDGHKPQVQSFDVAAVATPLALRVVLPSEPLVALADALLPALSARGALPETATKAAAIGVSATSEYVVLSAIDRASDGWLVFVAVVGSADGAVSRRAVTRVASDGGDAYKRMTDVAHAVVQGASAMSVLPANDRELAAVTGNLDFARALFGMPRTR